MTMKKQYIILALGAMFMASCADEFDRNFEVGRPDNLEQYAYLSDYQPLKSYIDQSKYPNFKLGVGTDAADYAKQGVTYVVTNSNFTETVAGNAMKMASCVDDNGNWNFGTVTDYVRSANEAGLSVYGHTLAWHAQQPVKWLNTLLADKPVPVDPNAPKVDTWVEQLTNGDLEGTEAANFVVREPGQNDVNRITDGVGYDGSRGIVVHSHDNPANAWDTQFFIYTPDHAWKDGDQYRFKMKIRADKPAHASIQAHAAPGAYQHWTMLAGGYDFTTEWKEVTYEGTIDASQAGANGCFSIAFNLNELTEANNYYFDDMSWEALVHAAAGPVLYWEDIATNGDLEGDDVSCFFTTEPSTGGPHASTIYDGVGMDGSRGIMVQSEDNPAQDWDTQFFIRVPEALLEGTKIHVQFDYRADQEGDADTQAHNEPGAYQHWACIGSPHFTTSWQHWDKEVTVDGSMAGGAGMHTIAFNLAKNKKKTKFYFDNIKFEVEKESAGGGIPQTPEEKRDTLIWAMGEWIHNMMDACRADDGTLLVTAWDVVNEAISGGNADSEGAYALQHDNGDPSNFFWQDYLGDIDYVRTAVKFAREYGEKDIKLFINDYNLESDWDNNKKLTSLIKWIERWEADGVTKIDGIGTQMHISCYGNPTTQESKKKGIENMFKLMAATGKLVRVSELDMGYVDANGNTVMTADMTEEQHHQMADLYKWIIQKYFEIVPVAQQWGICQWCATDAPAGGGWRGGEPVGLWDQNYYRKHTYAGFADGLAGK